MRKVACIFLLSICLVFYSCISTDSETTIHADGSGTVITKIDLSAMMKMFFALDTSQNTEAEKNIDSTIYLRDFIAQAEQKKGAAFTKDERELFQNSFMNIKIDFKEQTMLAVITSKFSGMNQLALTASLNKDAMELSNTLPPQDTSQGDMGNTLANAVSGMKLTAAEGLIDYSYQGASVTASIEDSSEMQMTEQMYALGEMPVKITYNLPRAVKNITAKGKVEISADKKKITISYNMLDGMKDPAIQSYHIEF